MNRNTRPHRVMKPLIAALLLGPLGVQAAPTPDAGNLLQQLKPSTPVAPASRDTGLSIESANGTLPPEGEAFAVQTITISGNTLFATPRLHALVAEGEGKKLTLRELTALVARITDYYKSRGYPLSRAIIPAQTIRNGVVNVEVVEARYSDITLSNKSQVESELLKETLSPLQRGAHITQAAMDQSLLLLSDIPGVGINAILKPGETAGTSTLQVQASERTTMSGNLYGDNYGSHYTGRGRVGGTLNLLNPLHRGDLLSATLLGADSGMEHGRISYDTLLDGSGNRIGAAYSAVNYVLGESLSSIDAHGTARVASAWVRHPFVRQRDRNVYGMVQYDRKRLRDHIDTATLYNDRTLGNWLFSLSGDARDSFLSGGINSWSVGLTTGRVRFDDDTALTADSSSANTSGSFSRWNVNLSRRQTINAATALMVSAYLQRTNVNLSSSEKLSIGGPYSVRGYDIGVVSADSGFQGSAELHHLLGNGEYGQWVAAPFIDTARVTLNQQPWTVGDNSATLSSIGIALYWKGAAQWQADAHFAFRLGDAPAVVGDASHGRAWLRVSKSF